MSYDAWKLMQSYDLPVLWIGEAIQALFST